MPGDEQPRGPDDGSDDLIRLIAATSHGRRVRRVVVEYDDGRRVSAELPAAEPAAPRFTLRELKVIELFRDLGPEETIKGAVIARAVGVKHDTLRKNLAALVDRGVLFSHGTTGGYSRGPNYPEDV